MLALAVAVDVAISSLGGATGYELQAGGAQKRGQLAGPAAAAEQIVVNEPSPSISVSLRFFDADGVISSCAPIAVPVNAGRAACRPRFVLTANQVGYRQFLCEPACDPLPQGGAP